MQTQNIFTSTNYNKLIYCLVGYLKQLKQKPVIMCVGSNKVLADSIGPMVGELLTKKYNIKTYVYGNLNRPITSLNVKFINDYINKTHKNQKILVIDSSFGIFSQMGSINLNNSGIVPVSLLGKTKRIGNISISGVTLTKGFRNACMFKHSKKQIILNMSYVIASIVDSAFSITY